jgi:hypothetical protein
MKKPLTILLLVAIGLGLFEGRRALIQSWFTPGEPLQARKPAWPMLPGPLRPVRIVLMDGLRADEAARLPAFQRLCQSGLELRLEVGFPSVSLPVQHVLWTGAWQRSSGVMFAVTQLPRPVFESLPELIARRSGNAIAVAEGHREIVSSFPFSRIIGPLTDQGLLAPLTLHQEALDAAQSNAALVFIHTVAVDLAGHQFGPLAQPYHLAARQSDELLAQLQRVSQPPWTLVALSDHGHTLGGGHGDVEPEVSRVLACLSGPQLPVGQQRSATLPDLNRILAEQLHLAPPSNSEGRTLAQVLNQQPAPALPKTSCSVSSLLLAIFFGASLLFVASMVLFRAEDRWRKFHWALLPWSLLFSLFIVTVGWGEPSLSRPYIYPWISWPLLAASLPGAAFLALQYAAVIQRGLSAWISLWLLEAGVLAVALTALLASGWPLLAPPLCPWVSAWASTLLLLASSSSIALALWGTLWTEPKNRRATKPGGMDRRPW